MSAMHVPFGEVTTAHLARELGCVRQDIAALARTLETVVPALSHLADEIGRLTVDHDPDVVYPEPPRIPWRLFLTALSSAALTLAGAHFLYR